MCLERIETISISNRVSNLSQIETIKSIPRSIELKTIQLKLKWETKFDQPKQKYVHNAYNVTKKIQTINRAMSLLYKQCDRHTSEAVRAMPIFNSRLL